MAELRHLAKRDRAVYLRIGRFCERAELDDVGFAEITMHKIVQSQDRDGRCARHYN